METPDHRFTDNVPARARTIVKVTRLVPLEPQGKQVVTISARGRKGLQRRPLDRCCTRVREDLRATPVAYYSAFIGVSQRWQLRERVPDQDW